jgi:hypothetical protein
MAYRLEGKKSVAKELQRVLQEQNDKALVLLGDWQADPADRVHRARQAFKRIRAALRLIRRANPYVFQVENRFYRDQARRLSYARDTAAMVEVVDALAEQVWESLPRESLLVLRRSLQRRAEQEVRHGISEITVNIDCVCEDLGKARSRLKKIPVRRLRKKDLRKGAAETLRRGRKAFALACHQAGDDPLHEWRKDVKYAYYQAGLMNHIEDGWPAGHRQYLGTLAEVLGHAQDLAVLSKLLIAQPDTLRIDLHLQRLQWVVNKARRETRERALGIGVQIFGRPQTQAAAVLQFPGGIARQAR